MTKAHTESNDTKDSLTLTSTVAMGTGVMIGAGIFALTGQVAQYAGGLFPFAFLVAAIISGFSAYSYVKVTRQYPSAGGVAGILKRAFGPGMVTGGCSLLMAFSMIINESLVARTFGTYTLELFDGANDSWLVPALAAGLIVFAYVVNAAGNKVISVISTITALVKIGGILAFAIIALWAAGFTFQPAAGSLVEDATVGGFLAGVALAILAYKGFTTITNSGGEVTNAEQNVGRAIMISLVICLLVYLLVAFAVGSSLSVDEIIQARDYALAEAARPSMGEYGVWFTVGIAMVATASGLLASVFAVSRMLTMLSNMQIIPHKHLRLPGDLQHHMLIYTVVIAALLAVFFDLGRIASLGAIFYLVMDIVVHWGVSQHLHKQVGANRAVVYTAIGLDSGVLVAFLVIKGREDPLIIVLAVIGIALIFAFEKFYLTKRRDEWTTADIREAASNKMDH